VDPCLGIDHKGTGFSNWVLYPNPSAGEFTIECPDEMQINIINALGQLVMEKQLHTGSNRVELNDCVNGLYFVIGMENDTMPAMKIIIKR
jgi:hypothetical protein